MCRALQLSTTLEAKQQRYQKELDAIGGQLSTQYTKLLDRIFFHIQQNPVRYRDATKLCEQDVESQVLFLFVRLRVCWKPKMYWPSILVT